jgi:hypothetical protein
VRVLAILTCAQVVILLLVLRALPRRQLAAEHRQTGSLEGLADLQHALDQVDARLSKAPPGGGGTQVPRLGRAESRRELDD